MTVTYRALPWYFAVSVRALIHAFLFLCTLLAIWLVLDGGSDGHYESIESAMTAFLPQWNEPGEIFNALANQNQALRVGLAAILGAGLMLLDQWMTRIQVFNTFDD